MPTINQTHHLSENATDEFAVSPSILSPNDTGMPAYGSEVSPKGPRQDMFAADLLAGGPVQDRTSSPATFTGGDREQGAGGSAIGQEPGSPVSDAGTIVQRGDRTGL